MSNVEERFSDYIHKYLSGGSRYTVRVERHIVLGMLRELYKENKLILLTSPDTTIRGFITGYKDWLESDG